MSAQRRDDAGWSHTTSDVGSSVPVRDSVTIGVPDPSVRLRIPQSAVVTVNIAATIVALEQNTHVSDAADRWDQVQKQAVSDQANCQLVASLPALEKQLDELEKNPPAPEKKN